MRTSDEHYAKGYTARKGESFQGRHRPHMLFIFDEAEAVDASYWTTAKTMFKPELGHGWLTIGNPTTTTSQNYLESQQMGADGQPSWRQFNMSAMDHPNIRAQLRGLPPPIPDAVTLAQLDSWMTENGWCSQVQPRERLITDFEWRPGSGIWWRPGPIAEARIFGRRPSSESSSIWSEALWAVVCKKREMVYPRDELPEIGVDLATGHGDDFFAFHARWATMSLCHETSNTMDPARIFGRLKEVAAEMAALATRHRPTGMPPVDPKRIPIKLDDDGVGRSVTAFLRADGYTAIPVGASTSATNPTRYPNKRSELWFQSADKAKEGLVCLARLDAATLQRLKMQATAVEWTVDVAGRRVVEKKDRTKEKIGRSPDDMDAVNLAYLSWPNPFERMIAEQKRNEAADNTPKTWADWYDFHTGGISNQERRNMYGCAGRQGHWGHADEIGLYGRGRRRW
jgi:hypothetical protein